MNRRALLAAFLLALPLPACTYYHPGSSTGAGGGSGETSVTSQATLLDALKDAAPSPKANRIFFVAGLPGAAALFAVNSPQSGPPETVADGFFAPEGVVVGTDGGTVYVADPHTLANGAIYAVPSDGSESAAALDASTGYGPSALDVRFESGSDQVYFTGVDPTDGEAGVFKVPADGGAVAVVAKGFPATGLSGVAVASDGTVFAAGPGADGKGAVFAVKGGIPEVVLSDVTLGSPAGIALTVDDSTLLVSSLSGPLGTSQVILYDVAAGSTAVFKDGIGQNRGSGGVHRARGSDVFAWAGVTSGGTGVVYRVSLGP